MNGKKIRFLIFLRCRATRRFWIYLLLIWLFFDPIIKPPKKDYKRKNRNIFVLVGVLHFCSKDLSLAFVWGTSLSVVVTNFQKIGASCWKKRSTKKILCQIIAYERPSLDDKHVFQLLGLLLLQANHSKNATLQVTFFSSRIFHLLYSIQARFDVSLESCYIKESTFTIFV